MKCFIHPDSEAVAVCKRCGKAMCIDCSSYSEHSGICPECRREEFERECTDLAETLQRNKKSTVTAYVLAALFVAVGVALCIAVSPLFVLLFVGAGVCGLRIWRLYVAKKPIVARLKFLFVEIDKLTAAAQRGSGTI